MGDELGDRMKQYEMVEAGRRFMPLLPVMARIDGRSFSKFTKGLNRPFDERFSTLMKYTTIELVKHTGAIYGYTQSDEISLVFYAPSRMQKIFFDGRISKLTSVLASLATAYFNSRLSSVLPEKANRLPVFDCRVWNVPNKTEAANTILWREMDAVKNSISMAAGEYYSHSQLHNKTGNQKQEMLFAAGVNWNDYPTYFKRGTHISHVQVERPLSEEELANLPPKHNARLDQQMVVKRRIVQQLDMPIFSTVINREKVIFNGEQPVTAS